MGLARLKTESYTWDDYKSWPDGERWEIIGGEVFDMSPSPSLRHQWVSMRVSRLLDRFFESRKCELLAAPLDVRLSEGDIVQPDLLVVCDKDKMKPTHIEGAPTLVIEILSPASTGRDHVTKFQLYARYGVKEYWIVTPHPALIEVYVLDGDHFRLDGGYDKEDTLRSPTFPDLELPLEDVFDFPLEPGEETGVVGENRPPYAPGRRERATSSPDVQA